MVPYHVLPYASLLTLAFVFLSTRVISLRLKHQQSLGDGGHVLLQRAIRVQGNFAEYVPLGLLLLFFLETTGFSGFFIHMLGLAFVIGRMTHAYGVSQVEENINLRKTGMVLTFAVLAISALSLLGAWVTA